jgi:hypothetical protein
LPQGFPLNWHDDGSLTAEARKIIRYHLPGVRIIDRSEADEKVQTYLEKNGFFHLANLRKDYVHLLKFTDVPFFAQGRLLQFDSDVLCLQFPTELLASIQAQTAFLSRFNRDTGPSLAFRSVDLESFLERPILMCFNAGLILTLVNDFNEFCSFAERLLSKNFEMMEAYVLEQTLWAAWCTLQGASALPEVYDCSFRFAKGGWQERERAITQHYCAFASALFYEDFNFIVYPHLKQINHLERVIFESIRSGVFDVAK